jgi:phenylacetate-CoA ligase
LTIGGKKYRTMKLIDLYHYLPPMGRNAIASLRGYQLGSLRYGKQTNRWVKEALERDHWPYEKWRVWQEEQLSRVLCLAESKVPHYQTQRSQSGGRSLRSIADWPVVKKKSLRANPKAFLVEGCERTRLWCEHTSGTTGTPLSLWQDRESIQRWYALAEARWHEWYGVTRHDRWAILGGQLICPVSQKQPPFWVWNSGLNQLYLSCYHLRDNNCASYLKAIRDKGVIYLLGYASALSTLARMALEQGLMLPPLKVIISNAEPLYAHQREMISRAFKCPVRDTYGMSEAVCAASECEQGRMHLWPEVGLAEVLADRSDEAVPYGSVGRLVCTGFLNKTMPLIRYETGDRVCLAAPTDRCACGRSLPMLISVEGRCDDEILTSEGKHIGRLDPVFKNELPIQEAQIIQESVDYLRVLVVPGLGFSNDHERVLLRALAERVGPMTIRIERVPGIPRSANGKYKAVISKVERVQNETQKVGV